MVPLTTLCDLLSVLVKWGSKHCRNGMGIKFCLEFTVKVNFCFSLLAGGCDLDPSLCHFPWEKATRPPTPTPTPLSLCGRAFSFVPINCIFKFSHIDSRNVILLRFSPSLFRFFIYLFHSWHIIRLVVGGCDLWSGLTFKHTPSSRWKFEVSSATFIIAHASHPTSRRIFSS